MMLDHNNDYLPPTSSGDGIDESGLRASRLFAKFTTKSEDGDGGGASASTGSGGGTTLSSQGGALGDLGMIPNGPLRRGLPKGVVICPGCGYRTKEEYGKKMVTCPECGERFIKPMANKSVEERLADFREEQVIKDRGEQTQRFDCIPQLMDVIMESVIQVPHFLLNGDQASRRELSERLQNTLHGFINWSIRRELGHE